MRSLEQFSSLVAGIYDAALEPSLWPDVLERIVRATGFNSAGLMLMDANSRRMTYHTRLDADAIRSYDSYYGRGDPVALALERSPIGVIQPMGGLVPWPQLLRAEVYSDWGARHALRDGVFVNLLREGCDVHPLCLLLDRRTDGIEPSALQGLQLLLPHLRQMARLQRRIRGLSRERDDAFHSFEAIQHGIVQLDSTGRMIFANAVAQALLRRSDGLSIRPGGRLQAATAADHAALQALIGHAIGQAAGGSLSIGRPSGRRALAVHVLPVGPATAAGAGQSRTTALVVIADPDSEPETSQTMLRQLFGFTNAEAAVALRILPGRGLQEVADDLKVSLATVRSHQQRVFEKTGTRRQAELVRLLLQAQAGVMPRIGAPAPPDA
ncbi:helix-turn-helix transcriptional regulator [Inquilinus sp. Marseille-Q2685]|uniref:helix-turn-helix transcriptional regulator n=1 Tax=Inquilinus sp. Marseille-Q2685 TaxID=2866581 RepID=UPI001CE3E9B1|nr:helix-turn-helix transcriptional regulator [Inquilinus sp. Marseille-Q2685]